MANWRPRANLDDESWPACGIVSEARIVSQPGLGHAREVKGWLEILILELVKSSVDAGLHEGRARVVAEDARCAVAACHYAASERVEERQCSP
jgi:hypothetical protein